MVLPDMAPLGSLPFVRSGYNPLDELVLEREGRVLRVRDFPLADFRRLQRDVAMWRDAGMRVVDFLPVVVGHYDRGEGDEALVCMCLADYVVGGKRFPSDGSSWTGDQREQLVREVVQVMGIYMEYVVTRHLEGEKFLGDLYYT